MTTALEKKLKKRASKATKKKGATKAAPKKTKKKAPKKSTKASKKKVTKKPKKNTQRKPNKGKGGKEPKVRMPGISVRLVSDLKKLKRPADYITFLQFAASDKEMKKRIWGTHTQVGFAKEIGVSADTLVDWKKVPGFHQDMINIRQLIFAEQTADSIRALIKKTSNEKTVTGNDVRVLLTYTGEYKEKHEEELTMNPEIQAALDRLAEVLP